MIWSTSHQVSAELDMNIKVSTGYMVVTFKISMVMVTESDINRHHSVTFYIYHFYDVGEDGNVKFSTRPDSEPANRRHNTCIIHRLTVILES